MKTPKCVCCFVTQYTVKDQQVIICDLITFFSYHEDTAKCLKNIAFIIIISKSHDKTY